MNDSSGDLGQFVAVDENGFSNAESSADLVSNSKVDLKTAESSEETIRRTLGSYDIGTKLRQLRLRKKIALVDLGKHTGLSASMLSQLENGKLIPTLPTLTRIAMVFDVGLEHFFTDKRTRPTFAIVRAGERLRFPELPDSPIPGYFFEVLSFGATEKSISAYLAEFPRRDPKNPRVHRHDGAEFLHVLSGVLALSYQSEEHLLKAGDSVYFDSTEPHSYTGQSEEPARAIVVTSVVRI